MHESILSALLRRLAAEPEPRQVDLWPAVRDRIDPRRAGPSMLSPVTASTAPHPAKPLPLRRRLPRMAAVAAAAALVLAIPPIGALQPWSRPSSANAEEALAGLRAEVFYESGPEGSVTATAACGPGTLTVHGPGPGGEGGPSFSFGGMAGGASGVPGAGPDPGAGPAGAMFFSHQEGPPGGGTGAIVLGEGPGRPPGPGPAGELHIFEGDPGRAGPPPPGGPGAPTVGQMPNPTQLSDRLGQALGVSGDRVRDAMRQSIGTLPPPVDPLSRMATQLGVSVDRVREAFADPECPGQFTIMLRPSSNDLAGPAQRLGVSPDRLATAMAAIAPPPPPSFDESINRIAQNLGVTPERLRAALEQVVGPNRLFIVAPAPPATPSR